MSGLPVLLFLDVSGGELMVIMLVVFLVLGPEKMPDMARKAGRLMNQLKKATNDLTNEFKKETSVLQNEINDAHKMVDEQIESVRREVNRTKAQVIKDMDTEIKPVTATESEKSSDNNAISDMGTNTEKADFSATKKE
ncbi:MAG: twin-arginine translocase TatA/TatE family subunit [Bacteroidota bacterium]